MEEQITYQIFLGLCCMLAFQKARIFIGFASIRSRRAGCWCRLQSSLLAKQIWGERKDCFPYHITVYSNIGVWEAERGNGSRTKIQQSDSRTALPCSASSKALLSKQCDFLKNDSSGQEIRTNPCYAFNDLLFCLNWENSTSHQSDRPSASDADFLQDLM